MKRKNQRRQGTGQDQGPAFDRLWEISTRVKALGHLLAGRPEGVIPLDEEEIRYGLGELMADIAGQITAISKELEEDDER